MMYIFEGVDHSGKDTLIHSLNKWASMSGFDPLPVFDGSNVYDPKDCPPLVKDKKEFQKAIGWETVRFCKQIKNDVIINRFTWSEIVYSKVLRGQADLEWYWGVMETQLLGVAKIIYVKAPLSVINNRIKKSDRNKSQEVVEAIPRMMQEYDSLIDKTLLPVIQVDSNSYNPDSRDDMTSLLYHIFGITNKQYQRK